VKVVRHTLAHSASLHIDTKAAGADALHAVVGGGCGCVLKSDAPLGGIWMPLRGRLQLGGSLDALVAAGEARVTEADPRLHVVGRGSALWVALLGTPAAWRRCLHIGHGKPLVEATLLPVRHVMDHTLRRVAVALARGVVDGHAEFAAEAVVDRALGLQESLAPMIARCPGRSHAQRRAVFLRLQRVRNFLAENSHLDLDNEELAHMASYSPWHFIRAFRAAYQETPHAFLVRRRLERAHQLLRSGPLAVAEVAIESGFENRCAFSRVFRQRFGTTAVALRRASSANAAMPASALR